MDRRAESGDPACGGCCGGVVPADLHRSGVGRIPQHLARHEALSGADAAADAIARRIRTIPDFPRPGIQFRDITTLILDPEGLRLSVEGMVAAVDGPIDLVAGIEARGFVFAPAVALALGAGVILIRKDGKLPGATIAEDYALEYGADRIAIHADACTPGARVLLVDDLIATGGTARAAVRLLRKAGAVVRQASFAIDLPDLGGADALRADDIAVSALVAFPGH
ncbi:adenine phosphoribosyltransferase [Sphingomonas sp. CFBP 13720]|nr:adenine phosphoribosyltransferase [Sphingomonas sp. CFBP 13720]